MRGDYDSDDSADNISMEDRVARARSGTGRSSLQTLPDGRVIQKRRNAMPGGGFVSTYSDITGLKRTEEALAEKARALEAALDELKRSNTELEQFAYVASHDLQEPLRMVGSYCQLLSRRYRDTLGEDGQEFIGYAVDGAERMQKLINDLLMYSRVGTRGKTPAPVPLEKIMEAVEQNLKIAIQESGGRVTHDPLPVIMGDDVQMVQLLQNLIGNALKFRGEAPPEVHVSADAAPGDPRRWRISVRDNGIGIEPAYFDRIFQIFQRLHERGKYPGTGIGLAVCKKIVERHGGVISVASTPGAGSTFSFTLTKEGSANEF
jgi:light-regulated signal transduction histidine kinase (bacteriophytochrome)